MIYFAIPSITPRLEACALEAIERTTPEQHRVIVIRGHRPGEALDLALAALPEEAAWLFAMDDDAAPLKFGWLSWMLGKLGGRSYLAFGQGMAVGCLYHVPYLRQFSAHGVICLGGFASTQNPGDLFRHPAPSYHRARSWNGPWWLTNCEVYRDDEGDLVYGHLGGGTIGHTWHHGWRLYPRIPTWLWPVMVRRHLDRVGARPPRDPGTDAGGTRPLVLDRALGTRHDGARLFAQHPGRAWQSLEAGSVEQMERARRLQAWEER
jgi:hypothetical protein